MSEKRGFSVFFVSAFFAIVFMVFTVIITAQGLDSAKQIISYENGTLYLFGQKYILSPRVSELLSEYFGLVNKVGENLIPDQISTTVKKTADILSAVLFDIFHGIKSIIGHVIHGNM
jgi:predicted PurR-regulated permease PerM